MKVTLANLQKSEAEVEVLDACLKQVRGLLARHEQSFARVPELAQVYHRALAIMNAQDTPRTPGSQ